MKKIFLFLLATSFSYFNINSMDDFIVPYQPMDVDHYTNIDMEIYTPPHIQAAAFFNFNNNFGGGFIETTHPKAHKKRALFLYTELGNPMSQPVLIYDSEVDDIGLDNLNLDNSMSNEDVLFCKIKELCDRFWNFCENNRIKILEKRNNWFSANPYGRQTESGLCLVFINGNPKDLLTPWGTIHLLHCYVADGSAKECLTNLKEDLCKYLGLTEFINQNMKSYDCHYDHYVFCKIDTMSGNKVEEVSLRNQPLSYNVLMTKWEELKNRNS